MPQFLSQGDFSFPFEWILYWVKHFYSWSFQAGAPNPDGIIRLPSRILNFLVFAIGGNLGVSYFYIFSSLIVAFLAFYFFVRHFLKIKSTTIQVVTALFFAINPIFLGNVAKIGLVLAVATLPLCLLAIKATFERKLLRYLLLYILCLNISLIHPYTFAVNLAISGGYLLYLMWHHTGFVRHHILKFLGVGVTALLLHAYFILPMFSIGTVSKDVLSDNVAQTNTDYGAIVDVSTGDPMTGLSLSKSVFLDFNFYDDSYKELYFLGAFGLLVLIIGTYIIIEKRLNHYDKKRLAIALAAFVILVALTTDTILHFDLLIKLLIGLPGGWAFRSPLKWQLYIPMALFSILAIVLYKMRAGGKRTLLIVSCGGCFLLMNSFLLADISQKLLTPRTLSHFAALYNTRLTDKTLLFVDGNQCIDYLRDNPEVKTELNQVFLSKNVQVKHVSVENLLTVNLGSYDYIMDCKGQPAFGGKLVKHYTFAFVDSFAQKTFRLYGNQTSAQAVYAVPSIFSVDQNQPLDNKYAFASNSLHTRLAFSGQDQISKNKLIPTELKDVFETLHPHDLQDGRITVTMTSRSTDNHFLFVKSDSQPIFYTLDTNHLRLSKSKQGSSQQLHSPLELPPSKQLTITYNDPQFKPTNLVRNPSLEQGLWQAKVSDCYAYDNKPRVSMRLSREQKTVGKQSLELETSRHIACTGPNTITVEPQAAYLLSFDYQSPQGRFAGYNVTFDDPARTSLEERLSATDTDKWHTFTRPLVIPKNAHTFKLVLYAYPDRETATATFARYDNVSLINMPSLDDTFYFVANQPNSNNPPALINYTLNDPTRKSIHVTDAQKPFYLVTNETYQPQWQLSLIASNGFLQPESTFPIKTHIKLNNATNAWYIDPTKLCKDTPACKLEPTGDYQFDLVMEFAPQRWFYIGSIISFVTLTGIGLYFVYDYKRYGRLTRWKGFGR